MFYIHYSSLSIRLLDVADVLSPPYQKTAKWTKFDNFYPFVKLKKILSENALVHRQTFNRMTFLINISIIFKKLFQVNFIRNNWGNIKFYWFIVKLMFCNPLKIKLLYNVNKIHKYSYGTQWDKCQQNLLFFFYVLRSIIAWLPFS